MKILFFFVLFLLFSSPVSGQAIPGVPAGCCGRQDCRPAAVRYMGRTEDGRVAVRVDGVKLILPPAAYSTKVQAGSWYCWQPLEACAGGPVSEGCARCAVEAAGMVRNPVNPLAFFARMPGGKYFLAEENCGRCHR